MCAMNTQQSNKPFPYSYQVIEGNVTEYEFSSQVGDNAKEKKQEFSMEVVDSVKNIQEPYNPHEHRVLKNPTT
jgi:hypothetical protein